MKTIAHISDLHFGTEDPEIAACLASELHSCPPSLLVVSGDLTQRARVGQFSAARQFLARLPSPQLVVPGNHDVPLYDVLRRFLAPYARYRRWISPELCPVFHDGDLLVIGLNTSRSLTWKDGRISLDQIEDLREVLAAHPAAFRVVVTHHPFIPPPVSDGDRIRLVGRASQALTVLDEHGVDLLLAGHLHEGYSGITQPYYPSARRAIVAAQAGTAISRRIRQQANAYNRIRLDGDRLEIAVRTWSGSRFEHTSLVAFERIDRTWTPA